MDIDLNSSLPYLNISDLMAHIATVDSTSEKVEKLNDYVKELNVELAKIKESKYDSPLCILILTEAIQKLEKEILHYNKEMKANDEAFGPVPLENGSSEDMEMLEKSSDANKRNLMSSLQLGGNNVAFDTTKQGYVLHDGSLGLMREDVVSYENQETWKNVNFQKKGSAFMSYKRSSGVIIRENPNINNVQQSPIVMDGLRSFEMNFSENYVTNLSYHSPSLMLPSKTPRIRWTDDLHNEFVQVVDDLGGPAAATPKQIKERMPAYDLTIDKIKSHLQKYRVHVQKQLASKTTSAAQP